MASENISDIVRRITNKRVKELAEEMCDEMKELVAPHSRTGTAYNSIRVHWNEAEGDFTAGAGGDVRGGFIKRVFIGSNEKSAYYLDQGNMEGSWGGRIYPVNGEKLVFYDTRKGATRKSLYSLPSVKAYKGIHYAEEVADRHR